MKCLWEPGQITCKNSPFLSFYITNIALSSVRLFAGYSVLCLVDDDDDDCVFFFAFQLTLF